MYEKFCIIIAQFCLSVKSISEAGSRKEEGGRVCKVRSQERGVRSCGAASPRIENYMRENGKTFSFLPAPFSMSKLSAPVRFAERETSYAYYKKRRKPKDSRH
jgi:hypothetical protein